MGRWISALFAAGGGAGLAVVALPHWPGLNTTWCAADGLAALAIGAVLTRIGPRLHPTVFPFLAALGTVIVTLAVYGAGPHANASVVFFPLVGLYVGAMFTTPIIITELTICAAGLGGDLAVHRTAGGPAEWAAAITVTTIAAAVTAGITRANRHAALRDPLTGLLNRRALEETLTVLVATARRRQFPLSVAVIDLDHFRHINASRGHQGADQLLAAQTAAWASLLRAEDILARYGGDEFVLLLPDTTIDVALSIVDRLRTTDQPDRVTFSAGVATWDTAEPATVLIDRADRALFEAKDHGRNRVVAAPIPLTPTS